MRFEKPLASLSEPNEFLQIRKEQHKKTLLERRKKNEERLNVTYLSVHDRWIVVVILVSYSSDRFFSQWILCHFASSVAMRISIIYFFSRNSAFVPFVWVWKCVGLISSIIIYFIYYRYRICAIYDSNAVFYVRLINRDANLAESFISGRSVAVIVWTLNGLVRRTNAAKKVLTIKFKYAERLATVSDFLVFLSSALRILIEW